MFSRRLHMQSHLSQLRSTKSGMSERIISMHSNMSANAGMSNGCKTSMSAGSGDKRKTNTATHKGVDGLITEFRTRTSAGISLKCAFRTRKTKCKASGYRDGANGGKAETRWRKTCDDKKLKVAYELRCMPGLLSKPCSHKGGYRRQWTARKRVRQLGTLIFRNIHGYSQLNPFEYF